MSSLFCALAVHLAPRYHLTINPHFGFGVWELTYKSQVAMVIRLFVQVSFWGFDMMWSSTDVGPRKTFQTHPYLVLRFNNYMLRLNNIK
jgi:hypothetical protein